MSLSKAKKLSFKIMYPNFGTLKEKRRSVGFSPIIQVIDVSGEETFEKEFLRDLFKKSKAPFKNEVCDAETAQLIKGSLATCWMAEEDQVRTPGRDEIYRRWCSLVSRGRGHVSVDKPQQSPPDGGGVTGGNYRRLGSGGPVVQHHGGNIRPQV